MWFPFLSWEDSLRKNGIPLQYSCLGNSKDRGAWQAIVHGVAKSDKTERLSVCVHVCVHAHTRAHTHTYA